jgi:hypothetical protein
MYSQDNAATQATATGANTTACLRSFSAPAATVDYSATATATDSSFTLTWNDAPAAAIRVMYVAGGGIDFLAARVIQFFAGATSPQDVPLPVGWGRPDLLMLESYQRTSAIGDIGNSGAYLSTGVATSTSARSSRFRDVHGAAASQVESLNGNWAAITLGGLATLEPSVANWPADGFRLLWPTLGTAQAIFGLAIKLAPGVTASVGTLTTPITGTLPVTQNIADGAMALLWGTNMPEGGSFASGATLGGLWYGAYDGVTQGSIGVVSRDDQATASSTGRWFRDNRAISQYDPVISGTSPPGIASQALLERSGSMIRASWDDIDAVAKVVNFLVIGPSTSSVPFSTAFDPEAFDPNAFT